MLSCSQAEEYQSFMQFILIAHDKAGGLPLRMSIRPAHLTYCEQEIGSKLVYAGPMLDVAGNPAGSVMIVETADEAEARALFAKDPYALAGLFGQTSLTGFRTVFCNGERVRA
jgi:uncharacterized protein YciI